MRRGAAISLLSMVALLLLLVTATAGDDGAPSATKAYSSADGRFTLTLPSDWVLDREPVEQSVMAWRVRLPGDGGAFLLRLYHVPGFVNPRAQAYVEREPQLKDWEAKGPAHVELDPLPQMWFEVPDKNEMTHCSWMYRVIRRNGITLVAFCDAPLWPKVREACQRAAMSITAKLDEWPPPPDGYRTLQREGISYRLHASVKDADVDVVHKLLRDTETAFAKVHGPVPKTADAPFVVYVHARPADAAGVDRSASEARHGQYASLVKLQLYAVPPAKGDADAAADLVREAWQAFLSQTFGNEIPFWLYVGEGYAAGAESATGRPLPAVPESLSSELPKSLRRLDELVALSSLSADDRMQMFVYVAFLRCGAKPWRDAFAAFLKDSAANGDCTTAQKERLLSLDQEKLRTAAQSWLARGFTVVKGR